MADDLLLSAKDEYARGLYASALRLVQQATPRNQADIEERDCLHCECLYFKGDFGAALAIARSRLDEGVPVEKTARYWQVVGRIRLEKIDREGATEALHKALRAAQKSSNLAVLASVQQLRLIAAGETLGTGLASAVRDAYRTAVRSAEPSALASFHIRLARLEGERGSFAESLHHLDLAQSILERCPHLGLQALASLNRACALSMAGDLEEARARGEEGAGLAEEAGYVRLAMAAAATVSYIATASGSVSVAESWLRKARKTAILIGVTEIGVLDNIAMLALIHGDTDSAAKNIAEIKRIMDSRDHKWSTSSEVLTLFTALHLHKRVGDKSSYAETLQTIKSVSEALNDRHSQLLGMLVEAECLFDDRNYLQALEKTKDCLARALDHPIYSAQLARILARALWLDGRHASARRMLLRASSSALLRDTRLAWADALRDIRAVPKKRIWDAAYSLADQMKQADSKFGVLMTDPAPNWFATTRPDTDVSRDPLDGFDDAIGILLTEGDPRLRGREALATAVVLGIADSGTLSIHTDSGIRSIARVSKPSGHDERLAREDSLERIDIGSLGQQRIELTLLIKEDIRSRFGVIGLRRLLEAASALESRKKDQQRLGALWQPEIIIEEPGAVFSSPQMIELMQTARKVAATSLPVLLMGPTGTGKEVLARAIHRASPRANKIFLPFNCSAVPRDMVESQLFGYRRGSFTGAHADFPGIIRSAEGGTLFLDEIGELSMELQPKLLRFLETNEVHPLGEGKPIKVDVRIIAATNADLDDLIERKEFREDLYYRLNIVRFQMPQLAERREEIPPLVMHLLRRFEMDEKKHSIKISDELMEYLLLYKWPGNVRQLSNELRKMVAMVGSHETLTPDHLSPAIRATRRTVAVDPDAEPPAPEPAAEDPGSLSVKLDQPLHDAVAALERAMIERAIARTDGHIEEAARLLGISRKGLFLKRRRWHSSGGDTPPAA